MNHIPYHNDVYKNIDKIITELDDDYYYSRLDHLTTALEGYLKEEVLNTPEKIISVVSRFESVLKQCDEIDYDDFDTSNVSFPKRGSLQ